MEAVAEKTENYEQHEEMMANFIEIDLPEQTTMTRNDMFLVVKETLSRIGLKSRKENESVLHQSCHILSKRDRLFIVHFKELFALDGKKSTMDESDIMRRNTIAKMIESFGLVQIQNPEIIGDNYVEPSKAISKGFVHLIRHRDKEKWSLVPKYNIGKYKRKVES